MLADGLKRGAALKLVKYDAKQLLDGVQEHAIVAARHHETLRAGRGYRSGLRSCREIPVRRSTINTCSAGTRRWFQRVTVDLSTPAACARSDRRKPRS